MGDEMTDVSVGFTTRRGTIGNDSGDHVHNDSRRDLRYNCKRSETTSKTIQNDIADDSDTFAKRAATRCLPRFARRYLEMPHDKCDIGDKMCDDLHRLGKIGSKMDEKMRDDSNRERSRLRP
jgi:hypothetical protein